MLLFIGNKTLGEAAFPYQNQLVLYEKTVMFREKIFPEAKKIVLQSKKVFMYCKKMALHCRKIILYRNDIFISLDKKINNILIIKLLHHERKNNCRKAA